MAACDYQHLVRFPDQLKPDFLSTLLANGKNRPARQRGLMHQPVTVMVNTIDTGAWHPFSGTKIFLHLRSSVSRPGHTWL